jgi:hypothetical protein
MTPIETYDGILVKRDDLCFSPPAPPFSKCRGVIKHLEYLKLLGINTVGYTETSISMAGWGVAWACKELGMKAVIFDPQYKKTPDVLAYHRTKWKQLGATIIPIKAGMAKVNYYVSKKILLDKFEWKSSKMLPLGLPFWETIEATRDEVIASAKEIKKVKTVVCCVGSGTIISGVWAGLDLLNSSVNLFGVMTKSGNISAKRTIIETKADIKSDGLFKSSVSLTLIDPGWKYTDKSNIICPFPCHAYYDLKAWDWLMLYRHTLIEPILFWNIGH